MSRIVLITGTTRGLGRQLAEHYLAQGDRVIGCGRGEASIDHVAYAHHVADLTSEADIQRLFQGIRRDHGSLDALINNAGVASMNAFALMPAASIRRILDTNVLAPMLVTHAAVRLLKRSTAPRVVNVSSIAVPLRLAGEAVYAASKSAVETFTRVTAHELGSLGITCNAVGPSLMPTQLTAGVPAEKARQLVARQAIPREARIADLAHVIDFFLSPGSGMITGQVVYLGGFS